MARITLSLEPSEKDALINLATKEQRDPRYQAALIIRAELIQRGMLPQAEALAMGRNFDVEIRLSEKEFHALQRISRQQDLNISETLQLLIHQEAERSGVPVGLVDWLEFLPMVAPEASRG